MPDIAPKDLDPRRQVILEWMTSILGRKFRSAEQWASATAPKMASTTITRFLKEPDVAPMPTTSTLSRLADAAEEDLPSGLFKAVDKTNPAKLKASEKPAPKNIPDRQAEGNYSDARIIPPIAISHDPSKRLPIMGSGVGGKSDALLLGNGEQQGSTPMPPQLADVLGAFAVYVIGDSMLERFRPGELVYIHPHRPVRKGDDVLIGFRDGTAVIKRFVSRDDTKVVVEQLNPAKRITYDSQRISRVFRIVGSATE